MGNITHRLSGQRLFHCSAGLSTAAWHGEKIDLSPDFDHVAGLVATNAVASLAATNRAQARWFTEVLWEQPVPAGQFRYYNGMLYLLSMLPCEWGVSGVPAAVASRQRPSP